MPYEYRSSEIGLNIWGKKGCERPDGSLCTLCCYFFQIAALNKPAQQECDHVDPAVGCKIHGKHPEECQQFHCSRDASYQAWYGMYGTAYQRGWITLEEKIAYQSTLPIS